mgnify:CR=1 FL=1
MRASGIYKSTKILIYTLLTLWAIVIMVPLYWMITSSIKPESTLLTIPPELFPEHITFKHYITMFSVDLVPRWLLNSCIVTGFIILLSIFFDSMAGYSYAVIKPAGHKIIFIIILGCMMVPDQIRLVPVFMLVKNLGLYNSYPALILPFAGSVFGMFLIRQYMRSINIEMIEAAKIEGCNELGIYAKIVMPICKPVIAVNAIFFFVGTWNSLLWPLIMTSSSEMRTYTVGLATFQTNNPTLYNYGVVMAGATISALPIIVLFLTLQKYFTKGITLGAVKE